MHARRAHLDAAAIQLGDSLQVLLLLGQAAQADARVTREEVLQEVKCGDPVPSVGGVRDPLAQE